MEKSRLVDITLAITHKCNSRCKMCNIWKMENPENLNFEALENLGENLKYVNLTGGEPFLNTRFPEIVEIVKKKNPKAQIIISSNGLATELILAQMEKAIKIDPKIGVRISLDGIGETHNEIRGIENIFEKAKATLFGLKKAGVKNLGIGFTLMEDNADDLSRAYDFATENDLQFSVSMVQNSEIYFKKNDNAVNPSEKIEAAMNYIIKNELKSRKIKKWLRAYFEYGLLFYAKNKKRLLPSGAGFDSAFIDADGSVYPSNLINLKIGNINKNNLDEIWAGAEAQKARKEIKEKKFDESWTICTLRGEMRKNALKIGWWIIRNKFKVARLF